MKYKKLSINELKQFKYPNLMAELMESGYSICTLGYYPTLYNKLFYPISCRLKEVPA